MFASPRLAPFQITAVLAGLSLSACGRGANQSAARTAADTSVLAPPVGSMKPTMDSAVVAGKDRLDSLKNAGVTVSNGLDSTGEKVQTITRNDPGYDTSHLNNRATPGAGPDPRARTAPNTHRP